MNDIVKTAIVAALAVGLACIAAFTAPGAPKASETAGEGELFFPGFTDPFSATAMQVVEYDKDASQPAIFRVEFKNGRWTIPSHHDYPADGKERLAKTATFVMAMRKDSFRGQRKEDQATYGVIDPEDSVSCDPKDRGRRVTLTDAGGKTLADVIIGKKLDGEPQRWFVRAPGEKRVYAAKVNVDLSTKFADWIERDLTQLSTDDVWRVTLVNYALIQSGSRIGMTDKKLTLIEKSGDTWGTADLAAGQEVDPKVMGDILKTVDDLKIVGVRRKSAGMAKYLKDLGEDEITDADIMDMEFKGFFGSNGHIYSKEGELLVSCEDGVIYNIRFGAVFTGSGLDLSAGEDKKAPEKKDDKKDDKKDPKAPVATEARYLMIDALWDKDYVRPEIAEPAPRPPSRFPRKLADVWSSSTAAEKARKAYDKQVEDWKTRQAAGQKRFNDRMAAGQKRAKELEARFADWYYVIDASAFATLHVTRDNVVHAKPPPPPPHDDHGDHGDGH